MTVANAPVCEMFNKWTSPVYHFSSVKTRGGFWEFSTLVCESDPALENSPHEPKIQFLKI